MSKNIKAQFSYAISSNFFEGVSKHSIKAEQGEFGAKIFSYSSRNALKDTASDFSKFLKNEYPEIRQVKDIKQEHVKAFLESKKPTCSQATLQQYQTRLDKLGKCCSETYGRKINFKVEVPRKEANTTHSRTIPMKEEDYQKVLSNSRDCDSKIAIQLSHAFGLRVSETIKIRPCDILANRIFIHQSKGGRDRTLEVRTAEQKDIVEKLRTWRSVGFTEPILKVKADSVNNFLKTNLERLGIKEYAEHKTGIHSIRKNYAIRRMDELTVKYPNKTEDQKWNIISKELGHGDGRGDLKRIYLCMY